MAERTSGPRLWSIFQRSRVLSRAIPISDTNLLIIKGREPHALEVPAVPLLAPHHDPHGAPLRRVHRLDHPWDLVDKRDGASDVVDDLDVADLRWTAASGRQKLTKTVRMGGDTGTKH